LSLLFWLGCATHILKLTRLLLSPKGIIVEQVVDWCTSG
jgi:hypothetical protein